MNKTLIRRYLSYFVIIALTASLISFQAGRMIRLTSYRQTEDILLDTAFMIKTQLLSRDIGDIDSLSKKMGTDNIRITVIRDDGTVIADSRADITILDNHAEREEIIKAINGKTGISRRYSISLDQKMIYTALPVFSHRGTSLVLRTAMAVQDIRKDLQNIYIKIILTGIITFLLISLLTILFERKMINPIPELQKAAAAYASGELDYYLKIDHPLDLKQTADSLNIMAKNMKQHIAEVTARKNELHAVFSSMVEAVVVLDRELKVRDLNPSACKLINTELKQARGQSLLDLFRNTELFNFAKRTLADTVSQELNITLSAGNEVHLQAHSALLPEDPQTGSPGGVVLVFNDITKLKMLQDMRKDFVANVSHELKTPITTVKGYLETLLNGALKETETAERFIKTAAKHADRLNAILDDLLSLSRLEQQKGVLPDTKLCSLKSIAQAAIQNCTPKASKNKIAIEIECSGPLKAHVNPLLIEQALTNLIDNAIKYSDSGSIVTVGLSSKNQQTLLSVTDHGIGIYSDDLPRVFERFYRVDKARSRELGGTGLGLAIVKHIALAHGGTVSAESIVGEGSTFTIFLPSGV